MHVALCPVKQTAKFVPIVNFFERQVFDWSAGDDGSDWLPTASRARTVYE